MTKKITLKIGEELHQKARVLAAKKNTSLSAMVRDFLEAKIRAEDEHDGRVAGLKKLYQKYETPSEQAFSPLTHDEIYCERVR
jgi:plasmid stability protein